MQSVLCFPIHLSTSEGTDRPLHQLPRIHSTRPELISGVARATIFDKMIRGLRSTSVGHVSGRVSQNHPSRLRFQAALRSEGSLGEDRNNNQDAAEDQCEIADAKQTEAGLVC
jgi:hypothetical protein